MKTCKKLLVQAFAVSLFAVNVSCSGGNKIDRYNANSEKFVEKWKQKTSGENPLSEADKKELKEDLMELGKAQLEMEMEVDELAKITPEQQEKLDDLTMEIAFIGIQAQ